MRTGLLSLLLALAGAPALAQTSPDGWVIAADPALGLTTATARFAGGQAITVQCRSGALDVMFSGLPPLAGRSRYVEVTPPGRPTDTLFWTADGDKVVSATPGYSARMLRRGGPLQLSVALAPEADSALARNRFELPAQSGPVDRVLEACGKPLTDPRDELVRWNQPRVFPSGIWGRPPRPEYPEAAIDSGIVSALAVISCVVGAEGRLQECRTERESDPGSGFGTAALASTGPARLSLTTAQGPQVGQVMILSLRFQGP
jgi:hypothetical protein